MESTREQLDKKPRRHWLRWGIVVIVTLLIVAELVARFGLGLGDPPLSMVDPTMEYINQPSKTYHRFHHIIHYNAFSMRSGEVTPRKTDPSELRVLMIGDSVINGGAQTDDSELATTLLQNRLHEALHRPVFVGNISAGSWGPPNELAYTQRFGWFDADVAVIVLSSHDYADAPTFEPTVDVHPAYPSHSPMFALQELIVRYLIPKLRGEGPAADPGAVAQANPKQSDIDWCLESVRQMVNDARKIGADVIVAQHFQRDELDSSKEAIGHADFTAVVNQLHAQDVELGPAFKAAIVAGQNPYRDYIHPNVLGDKLIADALYQPILQLLQARIAGATTRATTVP